MGQDRDGDGLLEGEQMNTLDTAWFGPMAWISSLYLAAVSAGRGHGRRDGRRRVRRPLPQASSRPVGRAWSRSSTTASTSSTSRPTTRATTRTSAAIPTRCSARAWRFQVGLPRIVPEAEARSALRSLWRYNFTPDVGPYREKFKTIPGGRWYAMPGEGGLLVTTFPHGGADKATGKNSAFAYYFNECWTGFEYQVAAHMLWEGMVTEGLAIVRMIHDRYHPARRNPYNEVECSDHYARAMASHGVFLAACGFEYHGPKGHLGFAPRLTPRRLPRPVHGRRGLGDDRAEAREASSSISGIEVRWGTLRIEDAGVRGARGTEIRRNSRDHGRPRGRGDPCSGREAARRHTGSRDSPRRGATHSSGVELTAPSDRADIPYG